MITYPELAYILHLGATKLIKKAIGLALSDKKVKRGRPVRDGPASGMDGEGVRGGAGLHEDGEVVGE